LPFRGKKIFIPIALNSSIGAGMILLVAKGVTDKKFLPIHKEQMKKIKAVIFDIDGTLANTIPLIIQAYRQAVEPLVHRSLSDDEIAATFGPSEEGSIRAIAGDDYKKGTADFLRLYNELHDMCPAPFEGITELLETLKSKGVRLAIATGKGQETINISLQRFNLAGYFERIEAGSPEGSRKIEAIQLILDKFSVKKDEVVYVGDSPGDITESREAGVPVVAAAWAETAKRDKLKELQPDEIFYIVQDFAKWLYTRI
jgi:phosphoglycolate phosphatase/pyrophosphatase PpaX